MSLLNEFKKFAMRGNVLDMAVGVILGTAFGNIVSSFVSDVIMPPLGIIIGGVDFSDLAITLKAAADGAPAVVLSYGKFIQTVIDFTIIAFAIFMGIKGINRLTHHKEESDEPAQLTADQTLLTEIRDLLKENNKK